MVWFIAVLHGHHPNWFCNLVLNWYCVFVLWAYSDQSVRLITSLLQVPKLRMIVVITVLSLYAFVVGRGTTIKLYAIRFVVYCTM